MSTIWVLGAGQLGAMLQQAGAPLALDVRPIDIEANTLPALKDGDIVTAEREAWPVTAVTSCLASHANFKNLHSFPRLADRLTQKQLIDELALATAPWAHVDSEISSAALHQRFGERVLLKRRTGGYDGKGQWWLKQAEGTAIPEDWRNAAIAEQAINFDEEVSIVGARAADGSCVFYPLTLNLHVNGILKASVAPLPRLHHLQARAEQMLGKLMNALDYVGVMAMECFRVGDELLINELAPRVHNSGHWTQAGANISQFELHLRAIAGLPLVTPVIRGNSVMVNLVGTERNNQWLAVPGTQLHWYGKEVRVGRKVGHINVNHPDGLQVLGSVRQLEDLLPEVYADVLKWVERSLFLSHYRG